MKGVHLMGQNHRTPDVKADTGADTRRGRRSRPALATRDLPAGVVEIEQIRPGWFLIAVGRKKHTRRFNLTADELAALIVAARTFEDRAAQAEAVGR